MDAPRSLAKTVRTWGTRLGQPPTRLVEFVELFPGHRGDSSVWMFVEPVQGDVFPWYKSSLQKTLNHNAHTAALQRLYDD